MDFPHHRAAVTTANKLSGSCIGQPSDCILYLRRYIQPVRCYSRNIIYPRSPKGLFLSVTFYRLPRKRGNILLQRHLIIFFPSIDSVYTLGFSLHFFLLRPHNILYTQNVYFQIYISDSHVYQISSMYFFLLNIPQNLIHLYSVVFQQAYAHDQDIFLLLQYSHPFAYITCSIHSQYLALIDHLLSFFKIWVQIQYDTFNSILYLLNYLYPFGYLLCFYVVGEPS